MKIAGLQKVTLIDFPDRIAATVFVAGCNLRCGYCYNRWMIDAADAPEAIGVEALLAWLRTRVGKLDGVCVSGGEPTAAPELPDLLRAIRGLGFAVKLDTNGTRPDVLRALLDEGLLEYVAVDVKAPLDARYTVVAGRPVAPDVIRQTLALLRAGGVSYELRTTAGPDLDRAALADIAATLLPGERWYLQPFVPTVNVSAQVAVRPAPSEEELKAAAEEARGRGVEARVRGEE